MKGLLSHTLALLCLCLWAPVLFAGEQGFQVSRLHSIPQNDINSIFRDSKGFMWVGTLDGLVRFDGYSSKTYRMQRGKNSISSNMIYAIDEDHLGNIWVATFDKGLCRLDPVTETFTHYQRESDIKYRIKDNDITSLLVDGNTIWLGSWLGVSRITLETDMRTIRSLATIPIQELSHNPEGVGMKRIFAGSENDIWLGLNQSLVRVQNPYGALSKMKLSIQPIHTSSFCWIDSLLVAGGEQIHYIEEHGQDTFSLQSFIDNAGNVLLNNNRTLWVGNRNGVYSYSRMPDGYWAIQHHFTSESANHTLSTNLVTSLAADESGQIWVGTLGGGVNVISPRRKHFDYYQHTKVKGSLSNNLIRTLFEDSRKNLWVGTEGGGLNYLSGNNRYNYAQGFRYMDIENYPKEYNRVVAIEEQLTPNSHKQERLIWLGTSFPTFLMAIDPETMEARPMPPFIRTLGFVFDIVLQNDTVLWLGTYGNGLWRLITDQHGNIIKHTHYTPSSSQAEHPISSLIIRSLLLDKRGNLWIATDRGLNRIMANDVLKQQPKFINYRQGKQEGQLGHDYILQLFQSSSGKIWMGSMGGGLISIEEEIAPDSLRFSSVTTEQGLPNNAIKAIQEDREGYLWLSSNLGITRYNPQSGDIVNYDVEDGLQDNEFAEIVSCARKNGQLIFGGNRGMNVFFPDAIEKDTTPTKLFFSDLFILNERIEAGQTYGNRIVLRNNIEHTQAIVLLHNQNSFSIGFSGIQFNSPQKNNYKYMLEGFDTRWYSTSAEYRLAKYTNIPAGNYVFKVLGSNSDNIWAHTPIQLAITIKAHPLRSTLAYIVYGIVLLTILTSIVRTARIISNRKKEALIAGIEKRNAEELAQMKLQFFTNISHEFRTPLSLISIPLEKLLKSAQQLSQPEQKNLNTIKQNTDVMLRLVNQILDFRKLDQNKMELHPETLDMVAFARDIYHAFEPMAEKRTIQFNYQPTLDEITMAFDPVKMEKVLYNLLSNALKYSPEGGTVELRIEKPDKDQVAIVVSDTGSGIPEQEQEQIFERYFQRRTKSNRDITGTGIGLSLTKGLVEMHKGQILLDSTPGKGSMFTVLLPIGPMRKVEAVASINTNHKDTSATQHIGTDNIPSVITPRHMAQTDNKVLVVEDNAELRETIAEGLAEHFTVLEAADGKIGLDMCLEHVPQLVVSDIMMPNMDGIELLTAIKHNEQISHIPVILLTAKSSVEDQIEGHLSGADAYIAKPFNADVLLANIVSIIQNRENLKTRFQKEIEINPMTISNSPADVRFMEKVLKLIEDNLSEPEFNVDKLAETYGISRIHLNRKIKALTGETPIEFLRNIKLKHAAELLKQGALNVSEVTWMVGYNDLGTFRKRFKEKFGISPSDYAQQWKDSNG